MSILVSHLLQSSTGQPDPAESPFSTEPRKDSVLAGFSSESSTSNIFGNLGVYRPNCQFDKRDAPVDLGVRIQTKHDKAMWEFSFNLGI